MARFTSGERHQARSPSIVRRWVVARAGRSMVGLRKATKRLLAKEERRPSTGARRRLASSEERGVVGRESG